MFAAAPDSISLYCRRPRRSIVLDPRRANGARFGAVTLAYAGFVAYGSLVPLAFKSRPLGEAWNAFLDLPYLQLGIHSRADWVANILLYIPLAFFLSARLGSRMGAVAGAFVTLLACAVLAVGVEFAQLFFPPRTVSKNDLIAELIGTGLGIALWQYAGTRIVALWDEVQSGGRRGIRALMALYSAAYLAFALFPYDFVISASELMQKLAEPNSLALFVGASCGSPLSCSTKLIVEILAIAPLGVFFGMLLGRNSRASLRLAFTWGVLIGVAIEGLQAFLASGAGQGISIVTRGVGVASGLAIYRLLRREWLTEYRGHIKFVSLFTLPLYLVLLLAMNGFFASDFQSLQSALRELRDVRFMPFYYHYFTSETQAVHSLLIHAGAYAPLGFLAWLLLDGPNRRRALWPAAIAAFLLASVMEVLKLFLEDKRPDPTNALIAAAAATLACYAAQRLTDRGERWLAKRKERSSSPPLLPPQRIRLADEN